MLFAVELVKLAGLILESLVGRTGACIGGPGRLPHITNRLSSPGTLETVIVWACSPAEAAEFVECNEEPPKDTMEVLLMPRCNFGILSSCLPSSEKVCLPRACGYLPRLQV